MPRTCAVPVHPRLGTKLSEDLRSEANQGPIPRLLASARESERYASSASPGNEAFPCETPIANPCARRLFEPRSPGLHLRGRELRGKLAEASVRRDKHAADDITRARAARRRLKLLQGFYSGAERNYGSVSGGVQQFNAVLRS